MAVKHKACEHCGQRMDQHELFRDSNGRVSWICPLRSGDAEQTST